MRPVHSFAGAVAAGGFIAAFAVIVVILIGGAPR
jgi:hypothetical protein